MRRNCWEHMGCGREPGGFAVNGLGVCPAATETSLNGVHGGTNAGRACWPVTGTLCAGRIAGAFAQKTAECAACDFYRLVQEQEGVGFQRVDVLLKRLGSRPGW